MHNCLLVGAQGGIGRCLLQRLVSDPAVHNLYATHRLPTFLEQSPVQWRQLDLATPETIDRLVQRLSTEITHLDVVICATGLLHAQDLAPEKRVRDVNSASLQRWFQVNAAGPLTLLAKLAPLLEKSSKPKVMVLSAQVGSIGDNRLGGWYGYRMSKAALNMGLKTLSVEAARWRNDAVVAAVHPGTTRTALSVPFIRGRRAPVREADQTAAKLHALLQRMTTSHHGLFLDADGSELPW